MTGLSKYSRLSLKILPLARLCITPKSLVHLLAILKCFLAVGNAPDWPFLRGHLVSFMTFFTFMWACSGRVLNSLTFVCVRDPTSVIPGSSFELFAYFMRKLDENCLGYLSKYSRKNEWSWPLLWLVVTWNLSFQPSVPFRFSTCPLVFCWRLTFFLVDFGRRFTLYYIISGSVAWF